MSDTPPIEGLVSAYRKIRDAISAAEEAHEAQVADLKAKLELVGAELLSFCNEKGLDSVKTPAGTVSRRVNTRYWTTDWESTYQFVLDHEAPFLLEKRIHNANMAQYLEANPDALPPGLQIDRKYIIQVRKPTTK
jgi:hypothetical protein